MKVKSRGESMKNWEYYKDDIKRYGVDRFAIKKDGAATRCYNIKCLECKFAYDCVREKTKFLYQEYKEFIKLTRLEYELLKYFSKAYNYITRDSDSNLFVYKREPKKHRIIWGSNDRHIKINPSKNLLQFIKWGDEEPILIQDVLDNCMVIEDE